ncbi:MAG: KH domain-containing protein [Candidatus Fermentibacteraceae bacterium]|nr:KH domain-containing protein [Candidatus Fermentibacteraceae bacterium]MBN2608265.1 KH domain-containing protein [Candidatus Fermentibacteraceae bacterium]
MKELVELMAKVLVADPESVSVSETTEEDVTVYELRVAESDLGRVIGREGKIAKAMRLIVRSAAARMEQKATVRIID